MMPGTSYQVGVIGMQSDVAQGIVSDKCTEEGAGSRQFASWEVTFRLRGVLSLE